MDKALIDTSILLEPFTRFKRNEKNYKDAAFELNLKKFAPF